MNIFPGILTPLIICSYSSKEDFSIFLKEPSFDISALDITFYLASISSMIYATPSVNKASPYFSPYLNLIFALSSI